MSLQVWLPLNGNLNNNGVANVSVTNNGATVDNNGKIGKCYSFGANKYLSIPNILTTSNTAFSFSCWVYVTQYTDGYTCVYCSRTTTSGKGIALWITSSFIRVDDGENWQSNYTFQLNTWTHITVTWNKTTGKKVFINGTLLASKATVSTLSAFNTNLYIGYSMAGSSNYALVGKVNDFRIYDHTLSEKEVKELSKGLILHYPLNGNGRSGNNIISNSTGYNGTTSWNGEISVGIENDKPYFITKRTNTSSTSRTFVYKLNGITSLVGSWTPGTKFTISGYYRIPSSETYNVQANLFIRWRLSTGSDSDANFFTPLPSAAVKDKWIRFEHTFSVPTNYAGGSANFYLSAFAQGLSTVHWKNVKVELGEVATPWCPSSSDAEYTKMGYNSTTEYDTSGNKYNGTKTGTLSWINDTPRYTTSTLFDNGKNNYISAPINLGDNKNITINLWVKSLTGTNGTGNYHIPFCINGSAYEFSIPNSGKFRNGFMISGSRHCSDYGSTNLLDKNWHMITATYDGITIKRYIDGELVNSTSITGTLTVGSMSLYLGRYASDNNYGDINILKSDLRIYATALSEEDIKELYNTAASISDNGILFASSEFTEN